MRSEETLENYFNHRIHRYYQRRLVRKQKAEGKVNTIVKKAESPLPLGLASIRPRLLMKRKPENGIEAEVTESGNKGPRLGNTDSRSTSPSPIAPVEGEVKSTATETEPQHIRSSSFHENGRPIIHAPITPHTISLHSLPSIHSPILHTPPAIIKSSPTNSTPASRLPSPSPSSSPIKIEESPKPYTLNPIPDIRLSQGENADESIYQQTDQQQHQQQGQSGGSDFFTAVNRAKNQETNSSALSNGDNSYNHDKPHYGDKENALQNSLMKKYGGYDGMIHVGNEDDEEDEDDLYVDEVVLVRKLGTVISLRERRIKVLKDLEIVSLCVDFRKSSTIKDR